MKKQAQAKPAPMAAAEPVIGTEGLAVLLRSHVPVTVIDARTGKFDDGRRLPGALELPMAPTASATEISALLPDKAGLVVTYCVNPQCPASHKLAEHLRGLGYANVLEYHEGIEGWTKAGLPVGERCPECGGLIPADM